MIQRPGSTLFIVFFYIYIYSGWPGFDSVPVWLDKKELHTDPETKQNTQSPVVLWDSHFLDSAVVILLDRCTLRSAEVYKSTEHFIIPRGERTNKYKVTPHAGYKKGNWIEPTSACVCLTQWSEVVDRPADAQPGDGRLSQKAHQRPQLSTTRDNRLQHAVQPVVSSLCTLASNLQPR